MRTLDDHELDNVSGGTLLLLAGLIGANILGGLFNSVLGGVGGGAVAGNAQAAASSGSAGGTAVRAASASTTALTPPALVAPIRQPGDVFDGLIQRGAGVVEAGIEGLAGHIAAGIRDVADLVGRLV